LQRYGSNYHEEFERDKIIIPAITESMQYALDSAHHYSNDKTSICIAEDPEFLVGLLNSRTLWWSIRHQAATRSGGYYELKPKYTTQLPIPDCTNARRDAIIDLVRQILANPNSPSVPEREAEIDRLVYRLYDLTPEEIAVIECSSGP